MGPILQPSTVSDDNLAGARQCGGSASLSPSFWEFQALEPVCQHLLRHRRERYLIFLSILGKVAGAVSTLRDKIAC
jgi:hypothetical protein